MTPKRVSPALITESRLRDPAACFTSSLGSLAETGAGQGQTRALGFHPFFSCSCLSLPHLSKWVHCPPDCSGPKPRGCRCLFSFLAPVPTGTPSRVPSASPSRPYSPDPDCLYCLCCFLLHHHHLSTGLLQQPPAAL